MRTPSASQWALAFLCGHPFTARTNWPQVEIHGSDFGNWVHAAHEAIVNKAPLYQEVPEEDVDRFNRHVERVRELLDADDWSSAEAEVILAYRPDTGESRRKASRFSPRYGKTETTAIVDLVGVKDGLYTVRDLKTGRQRYIGEARESAQLALGGLALARLYKLSRLRVEYAFVSESDIELDGYEMGPADLAMWAARFRSRHAGLSMGPMPPTPGVHCTRLFCPLVGHCEATRAALAEWTPPGDLMPVIDSDDKARSAHLALPRAEKMLAAVKAALREYVTHNPVRLDNGKTLAMVEVRDPDAKVRSEEDLGVLREVFGDVVDKVVETKTINKITMGSIDEGARALQLADGQAKSIAARQREVRRLLQERGVVRVGSYYKLGEVNTKE
jgi:hypothetical protein